MTGRIFCSFFSTTSAGGTPATWGRTFTRRRTSTAWPRAGWCLPTPTPARPTAPRRGPVCCRGNTRRGTESLTSAPRLAAWPSTAGLSISPGRRRYARTLLHGRRRCSRPGIAPACLANGTLAPAQRSRDLTSRWTIPSFPVSAAISDRTANTSPMSCQIGRSNSSRAARANRGAHTFHTLPFTRRFRLSVKSSASTRPNARVNCIAMQRWPR